MEKFKVRFDRQVNILDVSSTKTEKIMFTQMLHSHWMYLVLTIYVYKCQ